jgi:segregation and condensation protein B
MPTNEQPHQLPPSEENLGEVEILAVSETITESISIEITSETEGTAASAAIAAFDAEASEEAPFAGFEHDPGLEPMEVVAGEEEAAAAEPISYRDLNSTELQAAVEATFFMHHRPISISRLRELINPEISEDDYRSAVSNLMAVFFDENRGIELVEVANGFQLRTKAEHKDIMRRMYQIAPMKLTNAMLEVLAISAYNQPITREGIDRIRGVDSSHLLRVLLDKKMLRIIGKSDEIGRPMIYGTTKEFLELFGLRDLNSLPSLRDIEDMLPKNEVGAISEEELLAKEMEGIVDASHPLEFNDLEMEDLESNETQKIEQTQQTIPPRAHGHSGEESHGGAQEGSEAGGGFDLSPEVARRFPLGPEGNA